MRADSRAAGQQHDRPVRDPSAILMAATTAPIQPARPDGDAIGRFTQLCLLGYLTIVCLESPIRYVLYLGHVPNAILARDALMDLPAIILLIGQILRGKLHWAFVLFFIVLAVQGSVFIANFGMRGFFPMGFGTKLIINIVIGLMAGHVLMLPGRTVRRFLTALFLVSVAALLIEKLGGNFPWVGVHENVGGLDVELSRDWQVADPALRRVGGFFRSSIPAAIAVPLIAITVAQGMTRNAMRIAVLFLALGAVFLTTQKGSLLGLALVALAMFMPVRPRLALLRLLVAIGAFANATVTFFAMGMHMSIGHGNVASGASFAERIMLTWPNSWKWVIDHSLFPFGVGIGGMGAPLKQVAPTAWMFPDNMFIFMYAYFGVFAVLFYLAFVYAAWRSIRVTPSVAEPALATLAFLMWYGVVISIIEDPIAAFYLGGSVGILLTAAVTIPQRTVVPMIRRSPQVAGA
jgi:hypothetical protein